MSGASRVLVVNAGSSSLKLAAFESSNQVAATTVEPWRGAGHIAPIESLLTQCGPIDAVGHRVVHGGSRYAAPVLIDAEVLDYLDSITDLAPLHQPRALAGIREVARLTDVPAVAAFDTAFHATLSPAAYTYALPREWNHRWSLRRYGFHGLSHSSGVRRAARMIDRPLEDLRIVSCHLGAGASLAAVRGGRSVDTTMGFTPLAGLVMATRSGSVDPGLVTWLMRHGGLDTAGLAATLEHQSGLKGLSGTTGDIREVLAGRAAGDPDCALAFDVYVHVLVREIGAMAASAGGLDLLVFTGGLGERTPEVRSAAAEGLAHLGVALDADTNAVALGDADVTLRGAATATVVVTAAEAAEVARLTRETLDAEPSQR